MKRRFVGFILFVLTGLSVTYANQGPITFKLFLEDAVQKGGIEFLNEDLRAPFALAELYDGLKYRQLWKSDRLYEAALDALESASEHGLLPDDYHFSKLLSLDNMFLDEDEYLFVREILISDGLLLLGGHLANGKWTLKTNGSWQTDTFVRELLSSSKRLSGSRFLNLVDEQPPTSLHYRLLHNYRFDLAEEDNPAEKELLNKIDASMERMRREKFDFSGQYWQVNIPSYILSRMNSGQSTWSSKCIVGASATPTPTLSGTIEEVIINPSWYVPQSIEEEVFAIALDNPLYLQRNRFVVYDSTGLPLDPDSLIYTLPDSMAVRYNLIQKPGPANPLGKIKVRFPNRESIYLHDTPYRQNFEQDNRALSHGCIRVADIVKFVSFLKLDMLLVSTALAQSEPVVFRLETPQQLIITYYTASINSAGEIEYFDDIYDQDPELLEILRSPMESVNHFGL